MTDSGWQVPESVWAASGALFTDREGRVFLVEPVYKDTWEIPGGVVEPGESPRESCRREVREELGLNLVPGPLLCVEYTRPPFARWEGYRFIFDGGELSRQALATIRLQESELARWRFVTIAELVTLVAQPLGIRIGAALEARTERQGPRYLENGVWSDPG